MGGAKPLQHHKTHLACYNWMAERKLALAQRAERHMLWILVIWLALMKCEGKVVQPGVAVLQGSPSLRRAHTPLATSVSTWLSRAW